MSENRVIGRGGDLPWHLPADLAHFKRTTLGHPIIMGRKTFQSTGQPLPGRRNIVVTHQPDWSAPGVEVAHSLDEALELAREGDPEQIFIGGGEQIYRLALPLADRMYLTLVHARIAGDTMFPSFRQHEWNLVEQTHHPADDRHALAMTFLRYERKR